MRCQDGVLFFFFQAEDGIRDLTVTGVQTCALPISQVATSLAPSNSGLIYIQLGAVVTLIVLLIAFGVLIPTSRKLVGLLKQSRNQAAPGGDAAMSTQVGNLQKRLGMAARLGVFLLAVTFILMIVGASI